MDRTRTITLALLLAGLLLLAGCAQGQPQLEQTPADESAAKADTAEQDGSATQAENAQDSAAVSESAGQAEGTQNGTDASQTENSQEAATQAEGAQQENGASQAEGPNANGSTADSGDSQAFDGASSPDNSPSSTAENTVMNLQVGETTLQATLADTDAARALAELLQAGPITVHLHPYGGFEHVGALPSSLPASDEQITTEPGDIMLYQGNQITIFHDSNSWSYTPLGKIEGATPETLVEAFGEDEVDITLSLPAA